MFQIVVMSFGHVMAGFVEQNDKDILSFKLNDGAVVRKWGTTKGLGQLAMEGPQTQTELDPLPDGVDIQRVNVIFTIPCNEKMWKKKK